MIPDRRMVVFAGPHKSASSSVQELLIEYASNVKPKHTSFVNWTWPWNPWRFPYTSRKGFAPLVTEDVDFHQPILDTILQVWNDTTPTTGEWVHPNLIWGTEELDRFGTVPWSGRNGLVAIEKVWSLTRPSHLEIVVNYRRPRQEQWISIWKQLTRRKNTNVTYSRFLCNNNDYARIWEYLDCVANPLGFVEALVDFWTLHTNVTIHLLDLGGIASMQRDVGHVLACDVLGVECTADHWLPNMELAPLVENARSGDPGLTAQQLDDMEWILLQRDCLHLRRLLEITSTTTNPRLQFHYAGTLWDICEKKDDSIKSSEFLNTTFLLDLLQSQVGCGPQLPNITISDLRSQNINEGAQNVEAMINHEGQASRPSQFTSATFVATHDSLHTGVTDAQGFTNYKSIVHISTMEPLMVCLLVVAMFFGRLKVGGALMLTRRKLERRMKSTTRITTR